MKRQILTAILLAFLAGILSQFLICVIFDILNPPKHDFRDEFRGMKYGLVLIYNVLLMISSLSGLFFLRNNIGQTAQHSLIVWFLPRFLLQCLLFGMVIEWDLNNMSFTKDLLLLIPFGSSMVWWWYYFKIKKV